MENRRAVIVLLLGLVALAFITPAALAYDNVGMHRTVNAAAIVDFKNNKMTADPSLANAQLDLYELVSGYAWDIPDGRDDSKATLDYSQKYSILRSKWMGKWIVDGGYSGDEPEAPMAVRHFFDPKNVTFPFLTDEIPWDANPKMDAVSWVLTWNQNRYSFFNGKDSFAIALAGDTPDQLPYYGKAWRAVGETMHVMADLCNPAHVRNDAHPWSEPLEAVTNSSVVLQYRDYAPAPLDYSCTIGTRGLRDVMVDAATWANEHFFSSDTIPWKGKVYYNLPVVTRKDPATGYNYTMYNGKEIPAYRYTLAKICFVNVPWVEIEGEAAVAQQKYLVPTAIRASEAVLDAFLPRFAVTVDEVAASADPTAPGYMVTAHITHVPTSEWPRSEYPGGITIRNGARVSVYHAATGIADEYKVQLSGEAGADLNRFSTIVPALPGDRITVYYDFGGYKVYSTAYTITGTAPTTAPTAKPTTVKPAPEYQGGYVEVDQPAAVYSGGMTENLGLFKPEDPLAAGQAFRLTIYDRFTGGSTSPRMTPVDEQERMQQTYYPRNARVTIESGGLFEQDFSQNVEADDLYIATELPFRIRDNARPGAYAIKVTVTDDYTTLSATFEIMVA